MKSNKKLMDRPTKFTKRSVHNVYWYFPLSLRASDELKEGCFVMVCKVISPQVADVKVISWDRNTGRIGTITKKTFSVLAQDLARGSFPKIRTDQNTEEV